MKEITKYSARILLQKLRQFFWKSIKSNSTRLDVDNSFQQLQELLETFDN